MISQKTYSKGLPFAHLKKEKMNFLKNDKNTILQRKVSTPQSFKRKIQLILKNFSWISSFWNHHADLIRGLYHHHGWSSVFQSLLNYVWTWSSQKRYVGSLSKTQSQSSEWPLKMSNSWTTSKPDPLKRGTYAVQQRFDLNRLNDLMDRSHSWTTSRPDPPKRGM